MSVKRYIVFNLPIAHINGKLENEQIKLKNYNSLEGETPPEVSFFYGYRRANNINKSCFAKRINARDLGVKPYTEGEQENKNLFTQSAHITKQNYTRDKVKVMQAFNKQKRCTSPYHFAIGQTILNGGVWAF